jgi:hypothetical protein
MNPPITPTSATPTTPHEPRPLDKRERAIIATQRYIDNMNIREMSICTLRKAFEMGYLQGFTDGIKEGD